MIKKLRFAREVAVQYASKRLGVRSLRTAIGVSGDVCCIGRKIQKHNSCEGLGGDGMSFRFRALATGGRIWVRR